MSTPSPTDVEMAVFDDGLDAVPRWNRTSVTTSSKSPSLVHVASVRPPENIKQEDHWTRFLGPRRVSRPVFTTEFKSDAKIWDLYLTDAESVAKERAEKWKTWLDSILIFAGLFAGVVGSFVNALINGPSQATTPTPVALLAIETLWLCSLIITIFGAVMGVMAKAWISNFIPVSNRRQAEDAYRRIMLDKQADIWHLERVMLLIPLFVQMAAFLFSIGLAIRAYGSDHRLGILAISLIGGVLGLYALTTIKAAWDRSFPFNTPPSDLMLYFRDYIIGLCDKEEEGTAPAEPTPDEELARIWREKLILSTKVEHVKEGLLELNLRWVGLGQKWRDEFCNLSVLQILLDMISSHIASATNNEDVRDADLSSYFECLTGLILHIDSREAHYRDYLEKHSTDLIETLKPGGALYRWNVFHGEIQPLALCLRIHIVFLLKKCASPLRIDGISDYYHSNVAEQPWDAMLQEVGSRRLFGFLAAACRGLHEGDTNLKAFSSRVLCLTLAKVVVSNFAGRPEDIVRPPQSQTDKAEGIIYMKFIREIVDEWKVTINNDLRSFFNKGRGNPRNFSETAYMSSYISALLAHPETSFRIHGIKTISSLFEDHNFPIVSTKCEMLKFILTPALFDHHEDVRSSALDHLFQLLRKEEYLDTYVHQEVREALDKMSTITEHTMKSLLKIEEEDDKMFENITSKGLIRRVIEICLTKNNSDIAMDILRRISRKVKWGALFNSEIKKTFMKLNKHDKSVVSFISILNFVLEFVRDTNFDFWIDTFIVDPALKFLNMKDVEQLELNIGSCALEWLKECFGYKDEKKLTSSPTLYHMYCTGITRLGHSLAGKNNEEPWRAAIRSRFPTHIPDNLVSGHWNSWEIETCLFLVQVFKRFSFVSELVKIAREDKREEVQLSAVNALGEIVKSFEDDHSIFIYGFSEALKSIESSTTLKLAWVEALVLFVMKTDNDLGIKSLVETCLKHWDYCIRNSVLKRLGDFSDEHEVRKVIITEAISDAGGSVTPTFPKLSLKDIKTNYRSNDFRKLDVMCSLGKNVAARRLLDPLLKEIVNSSINMSEEGRDSEIKRSISKYNWTDMDEESKVALVSTLGYLAEFFPNEMKYAVSDIREIVEADGISEEIRSMGMLSLARLIQTESFTEQIQEVLVTKPDLLSKRMSENVKKVWIRACTELYDKAPKASIKLLKLMSSSDNKFNRSTRLDAVRSLTFLANSENLNDDLRDLSYIHMKAESNHKVRVQWIKCFAALAKNRWGDSRKIQTLLTIAMEDKALVEESIASLVYLSNDFRNEIATSITSEHLRIMTTESASSQAVKAWINLLSLLLPRSHNRFVPELAKAAIHPDRDVWMTAVSSLINILSDDACHNTPDLSDGAQGKLSAYIRQGLKNSDSVEQRRRAIQTIRLVTSILNEGVSEEVFSVLLEVLHRTVFPLLSIIIKNNEEVQLEATIAFRRTIEIACEIIIKSVHDEDVKDITKSATKLVNLTVKFIIWKLSTISDSGSDFITRRILPLLRQIGEFKQEVISDIREHARFPPVQEMIVDMISHVREYTPASRVTAMALLESIYPAYGKNYIEIISLNVQHFVYLSLNDSLDNIRVSSLKLVLTVLKHDPDNVLPAIRRFRSQFMSLLESDSLKPVTAELLSLMAKNNEIRNSILKEIISLRTSEKEDQLFKGYVTLLSRLLVDKRLLKEKMEPTDCVIVLYASTLVKDPRLQYLQFQVVSALWCYHRNVLEKSIEQVNDPFREEIMKLFLSALFGCHITEKKKKEWSDVCALWFPTADKS